MSAQIKPREGRSNVRFAGKLFIPSQFNPVFATASFDEKQFSLRISRRRAIHLDFTVSSYTLNLPTDD